MPNVQVDYQAVQNAATQLQKGKEEVELQLGRLKTMIDNLVTSGFVTEQASTKFQESYDQWNTGAKNVIGGLAGMTSFLNDTVAKHQDLDRQLGQSAGTR